MNIKLIQIDGKLPNLALMKISAWHKLQGDTVGFDVADPDKVYISCIFSWNRPLALGIAKMFDCDVEIGGYGVNGMKLPDEIEHIRPDYSLYGIHYSMGYLTRGCIRRCPFCNVWRMEGNIREHAPLDEFLHPEHKKVMLLDNNLLTSEHSVELLRELQQRKLKVCFTQGLDVRLMTREIAKILSKIDFRSTSFREKRLYIAWDRMEDEDEVMKGIKILTESGIKPRQIMCYMLTCYNTTLEEDMYRFNRLCECGVDPFVMRYNRKGNRIDREFSRWVNKRWYKVLSFDRWLELRRTRGGRENGEVLLPTKEKAV